MSGIETRKTDRFPVDRCGHGLLVVIVYMLLQRQVLNGAIVGAVR